MATRRKLLFSIGASTFFASSHSIAQLSTTIPRIGLLWVDTTGTFSHYRDALREGLREHGRIEGKNIHVEDRFLAKSYEQLTDAVTKLISEKVDLLFCFGATATQTAAKATSNIPIVMLTGSDPVKLGLANSLARPGKNITGNTIISAEIGGKRVEILRESAPAIRRIGVLMASGSQAEIFSLREIEAAGSKLRIEVYPLEVRNSSEIDSVVASATRSNAQGLVVIGSSLLSSNRKQVVAAIAKTRLPAIYPELEYADAGGLMAYNASITELFRKSAIYIDKILKGARPGELPIEQATKFEFVVNLKTAKELALAIPPTTMVRANRVIE